MATTRKATRTQTAVLLALCGLVWAPQATAAARDPIRLRFAGQDEERSDRPYLGDLRGRVTVRVYGDLQCPWTSRLVPVLAQVIKANPRGVKVMWHDFPLRFHHQAMPAAIAAREVFRQKGSRVFWAYLDILLRNQRYLTAANLKLWAVTVGVNGDAVASAVARQTHRALVQAEMSEATRRGVRGTPTIYINDQVFRGARTLHSFQRAIDNAK